MLYLICTTITSIDLAHYGVSRAKDWVSVKCGTSFINIHYIDIFLMQTSSYGLYSSILYELCCQRFKSEYGSAKSLCAGY